jgi:hypothetical protein
LLIAAITQSGLSIGMIDIDVLGGVDKAAVFARRRAEAMRGTVLR